MPRTNYGKRAFCYSGALLWNSLPNSLFLRRFRRSRFAVLMLGEESKELEEPKMHHVGQETKFAWKVSSEEAM